MSDQLIQHIATQGAVGYGSAPGTVATIMMLPLLWFVRSMGLSTTEYGMLSVLLFAFGWYVTARALPYFNEPDPSAIVIDEMSCFVWAFIGVPICWQTVLIGFVLFRLLDIYKPLVIGWIDQMGGVAGVMLDDLAAACVAQLCLRLLVSYFGWI